MEKKTIQSQRRKVKRNREGRREAGRVLIQFMRGRRKRRLRRRLSRREEIRREMRGRKKKKGTLIKRR